MRSRLTSCAEYSSWSMGSPSGRFHQEDQWSFRGRRRARSLQFPGCWYVWWIWWNFQAAGEARSMASLDWLDWSMLYGCFVDETTPQHWRFLPVRIGLMLRTKHNSEVTCSRMIMRGDVPFLRVIRIIPREMRDKLPQHYISLLETTVWSPMWLLLSDFFWQLQRGYQNQNTFIKQCWNWCFFTIADLAYTFLLWIFLFYYFDTSDGLPFQVWINGL